jgi:two-component system, OmpR family, sensor histidine kinase TctE
MPRPERTPIFGRSEQPNSLFGEILDWMLAPILVLWPISIAATHYVANDIANGPYDQALAAAVANVGRLVRAEEGDRIVLPPVVRSLLPPDTDDDASYLQIRSSQGKVLSGEPGLPAPSGDNAPLFDEVLFRDDRMDGIPIRVAYQAVAVRPGERWIVVQVAETSHKREVLVSSIISGVLLPQFAIIPLAVILVWLGLSRGLAPLNRLRETLASRRPGDLSALNQRRVPEEIQPMVQSFNQLMGRLEENLQAQQRFIADAAHQMRTPITGLKMQAELAVAEKDPAQLEDQVRQISASAERAAHLINQLLTLARAESSHDKIHRFETVDIEDVVRTVAAEWVFRARDRQVDLGFEGRDWPLMVGGVPLLLRELFSNLTDNAVKYTPGGGRVTLRVMTAGDYAVVEVEDSGIGIPATDRERVFERFYRVLGTGTDGSGLGLAICREIADLHRAAISIETPAVGPGTLVRVVFPRLADVSFREEAERVAFGQNR